MSRTNLRTSPHMSGWAHQRIASHIERRGQTPPLADVFSAHRGPDAYGPDEYGRRRHAMEQLDAIEPDGHTGRDDCRCYDCALTAVARFEATS